MLDSNQATLGATTATSHDHGDVDSDGDEKEHERRLTLFHGAVAQQHATVMAAAAGGGLGPRGHGLHSGSSMVQRLSGLLRQVRSYEEEELQAHARACVPLEVVEAYAAEVEDSAIAAEAEAAVSMASSGAAAAGAGAADSGVEWRGRKALLKGLMRWFKKDFFKWCNKPSCPNELCAQRGERFQDSTGPQPPNQEERDGWASMVEGYRCRGCRTLHRFPRYNHPGKLLRTRVGRCGEWANCFTLLCRSLGFEARHVTDWTDHVWTEVWFPSSECSTGGVWLHADPCENKLNRPRVYEKGWSKKLSYVFAAAKDHLADVTPRYTEQYAQVLSRRSEAPEAWLKEQVRTLSARQCQLDATSRALQSALSSSSSPSSSVLPWGEGGSGSRRWAESSTDSASRQGLEPALLPHRLATEEAGFQRNLFRATLPSVVAAAAAAAAASEAAAEESAGRETGSAEWRIARGEMGSASSASSASSVATTSLVMSRGGDKGGGGGGGMATATRKQHWTEAVLGLPPIVHTLKTSASNGSNDNDASVLYSLPLAAPCYSHHLLPRRRTSKQATTRFRTSGGSGGGGHGGSIPETAAVPRRPAPRCLGVLSGGRVRVDVTSVAFSDPLPSLTSSTLSLRAAVTVNGVNVGPPLTASDGSSLPRGHALVALDPRSGALLLGGVCFDTWGTRQEAANSSWRAWKACRRGRSCS